MLLLGFLLLVCSPPQRFYSFHEPVVAVSHSKITSSSNSSSGPSNLLPPESRPRCSKWHAATSGESQWEIARQYAQHADKARWIKSMRWVSGKRADDASLKLGEPVCVNWSKVI